MHIIYHCGMTSITSLYCFSVLIQRHVDLPCYTRTVAYFLVKSEKLLIISEMFYYKSKPLRYVAAQQNTFNERNTTVY